MTPGICYSNGKLANSVFLFIYSFQKVYLLIYLFCVGVDMWAHTYHSIHVEVREQLVTVHSPLPLCEFQDLNSGLHS